MPKASNIKYDDVLTYDNILSVYESIRKKCKNKKELYKFELNLNCNLFNILNLLKNRNYKFGYYKIFLIKQPKYRIIMSESICDKVVNHLVSKYILLPSLESKLIDTNVATRIGNQTSQILAIF